MRSLARHAEPHKTARVALLAALALGLLLLLMRAAAA